MSAVLFEPCDIDTMTGRFTLQELRAEKHAAEIHLNTSEYYRGSEYDDGYQSYWEQYLELVNVSIEALRQQQPAPAKHTGNRLDAADVKAKNDIVSVIERYTALRKTGSRYSGKCPIHDDRAPSMTVYPETQSFHCYGCQAHGDIFDFIQAAERCDFRRAIEILGGA
jgi:hypothetical protein